MISDDIGMTVAIYTEKVFCFLVLLYYLSMNIIDSVFMYAEAWSG